MLSFIQFLDEKKFNVNLTHREVSDHLKRNGWNMERQKGDHDVWGHQKAKHKIAVPRHKGDLAPGTVRDIIKKSMVA